MGGGVRRDKWGWGEEGHVGGGVRRDTWRWGQDGTRGMSPRPVTQCRV